MSTVDPAEVEKESKTTEESTSTEDNCKSETGDKSAEATSEPSESIPPARLFFSKYPLTAWAIDVYVFSNVELARKSFQRMLDSWVSELELMTKIGKSQRIKTMAQSLLGAYRTGSDKKKAKDTQKILLRAAEEVKRPNIVINTSDIHDSTLTITNNINSSVNPPAKRKRSKENERSVNRRPASAAIFLKHFRKAFEQMKPENKWKLRSGVCVEDAIYERFKDCQQEVACHSWVINIADESLKSCFSCEEWEEIVATIPKLPQNPSSSLKEWMKTVGKIPVQELLRYLDQNAPVKEGETQTVEPGMLDARSWIYDALRRWARLSASPAVFAEDHREYWYIANIWNTVFDQCMTTLPGAYMSRGESMSVSTSARKNPPSNNSAPKRRRVGRLYDGLLKLHDDEVGAAEHSRKHPDLLSQKWARDTLKVTKVLHDMLRELGPKARKRTVVGMVASGWKCQLMRMVYAKGYICTLSPDQVRTIPAPSKGVTDFLVLCLVLWAYRTLLADSMVDDALDNLDAALDGAVASSEVQMPVLIPHSVETDGDCTDNTVDLDLDEEEQYDE